MQQAASAPAAPIMAGTNQILKPLFPSFLRFALAANRVFACVCMVAMGGAGRLRAGAGYGGGGAAGHPHGRHQGFYCFHQAFLFWGLMLWIPISCPNLIVVTLCVGADAEIDPSESGIATTARCFQILLSPQVTSNRLQRECVIWLHFVRTPCVPVRNVARLRAVHLIFREFRVN